MRMNRSLPVPEPQSASPSAEVLGLRTSWKWAYLSHFLFTYNPMLHLEDIQLSELEDDLADGTFEVIPIVMQRLLTSLTPHDKRMILENWQHQLRKQSLRRDHDRNLLGTEDDPVDFSSLIMSDKLHVFQSLCEWQFHSPNNLRTRMKDDDDYANWRIEPIAYDAKGNAYWLMGGNRLWIQYAPPPKRSARSHKRKQPIPATTNGRKSAKHGSAMTPSSSRATAVTTTNTKGASTLASRPIRGARTRTATAGSSNPQKPRAVGTRVSTRLRGREEEEVWQPIPDDWLKEESNAEASTGKGKGQAAESKDDSVPKALDDVSELTSLSELSDIEEQPIEEPQNDESTLTPTPPPVPSPEFSEAGEEMWETLCVTLQEWEAFPQRFEKSTHRGEKAFYKLLINDIVPMITEVLRTDVRKKHLEEAVVHRKRSSRIAVKESVREAERAEARRKADEEKEMERHKRWEARARKEEEDRIRRENSRSARLRERAGGVGESMDVDVVGGVPEGQPNIASPNGTAAAAPAATPVKFIVNAAKSGTQTPKDDEPWELDCEICRKRGMNLDDGQELMCCERCQKWQHIRCHDQADFIAGHPRRNWELVDFMCTACAAKSHRPSQGSSLQSQPQAQPHPQLQPHAYSSHALPWGQYNGSTASLVNGVVPTHAQSQPDHRAAVPVKSTVKQQTSYDAGPYSHGRLNYPLAQSQVRQPYSASAMAQTQYHQTMATATGGAIQPTSSQSHTAVAAQYPPGPHMYLSSYSGNSRPPQNSHNSVAQPQHQSTASHYSTVRGQAAVVSSRAGGWPQQPSYQATGHPQWNGSPRGSAPSHLAPGSGTPQARQAPQQNGYYHSIPVSPPNPLMQSHQLASAQPYYRDGPTSQS